MDFSHSLFCRFENELLVGEHTLEWTVREYDLLFRPSGADVRIIWCELHGNGRNIATQEPERLKRERARVAENRALKRLWRFWPLDDEREMALCPLFALIRHKNSPFWLRLDWQEKVRGDELLLIPDLSSVLSHMESSAEAWSLLEKVRKESPLHWFQCSRGSMENLERVLWAFQVLWSGGLYFAKGDDLYFEVPLGASYQLNKEQWNAFGRILGFFDGDFALKWHPLSGRTYTPCGRPSKRPHIAVTPPYSVSEHEHLEAALTWREFLRNRLSEEKIEAQLKFKVRQ